MKKQPSRIAILAAISIMVLTAGMLAACSTAISEGDLSLRKEALTATTVPETMIYRDAKPGQNPLIERSFFGAPPLVPHDMKGSVRAEANDCLDCHFAGKDKAPILPPSHFIKARMVTQSRDKADTAQLTRFDGFFKVEKVAGNRYDCLLCHAQPAANANPLVANTFKSDTISKDSKDILDALNEDGKF